ncbi:MAG: family 65 glycosyl hydrolase [Chitinivibrionales bacterium]|nr:family 65 glycosyl hydrolase [Chitinivibrionales bacterium]
MAKAPITYLGGSPWEVTEEGFYPEKARVSESIFSLSNEFMGVRGYFEEGYCGDHLQGSYFGGLYENKDIGHPQVFKGLITRENFIINAVDWLYTRIKIDGEQLDLHTSKHSEFIRTTDLAKGLLIRSFIWETQSGKKVKVTFERFLSMVRNNVGCQRIGFEPLNFSGNIDITSGLNFKSKHEIAAGWDASKITGSAEDEPAARFWQMLNGEKQGDLYAIQARTTTTRFALVSTFRINSDLELDEKLEQTDDYIGCAFTIPVKQGKTAAFEKIAVNFWERPSAMSAKQVWEAGLSLANENGSVTFDSALAEHADYWSHKWRTWDITINGADDLQQGVRFDLFQFHMAYHGGDDRLAIPSKGLTAEVYSGWVFWVVETYCQHVQIFTDPAIARKLLQFRYRGLHGAIERAQQVDCEGARYPFCTIDGPESCATWQHADMEIHVGEGIFLAIWLYVKHTKDYDFLHKEGIEMLLQISRFYASRGEYSPSGDFGFYGVMGPDEYHTLINHNFYTNYMGKRLFEYTAEVAQYMQQHVADKWQAVAQKVQLRDNELEDWKQKAAKMRLLQNPDTGLCEQHDRYFDLPEVDVPNIPLEQIPIYKSWAYERIFRMNMVKQADVVLLPVWFSHEWPYEHKKVNFEYYEPRTIHESSFSPSIHMILAAELGKKEMADDFFRLMARLDLDDYNRNTAQGLHMTPKSGTWMCMVYGYGGMRTDREVVSFRPSIPDAWASYSFTIMLQGSQVKVSISREIATFIIIEGSEVPAEIYGKEYVLTRDGLDVPIEKNGR